MMDQGPLFHAGAEAGMVIAEKRAASEIASLKAEVARLRTIIKDAHEEMISEKGEYHIKSGLGQTMAAVVQQETVTK